MKCEKIKPKKNEIKKILCNNFEGLKNKTFFYPFVIKQLITKKNNKSSLKRKCKKN